MAKHKTSNGNSSGRVRTRKQKTEISEPKGRQRFRCKKPGKTERDDYEVGWCKPPKHSQFKRGQSGNPKGRPKGSKNLKSLLVERMERRITYQSENGPKSISFRDAIVLRLQELALKGNPNAIKLFVSIDSELSTLATGDGSKPDRPDDLAELDAKILKEFERQIRENNKKRK